MVIRVQKNICFLCEFKISAFSALSARPIICLDGKDLCEFKNFCHFFYFCGTKEICAICGICVSFKFLWFLPPEGRSVALRTVISV